MDSGPVDPISIPLLSFEGAKIQRARITKQDIDEFGAVVGSPRCNAIKDNKRAQAHSDLCRVRIEECLRVTPQGAESLDRRSEVCAQKGKTIEPLGGLSLRKTDGWKHEESHSLDQALATKDSQEGEERGSCSAALKELVEIIQDQVEERSVVVLVLNKESASRENSSMEALLRGDQLKYIDVEGMRVVTNNSCVAEQIKSDKTVNIATGELKMEKVGRAGKREKSRTSWWMGSTLRFLETLEKKRISKPMRIRTFVKKRNCASHSSRAS